jgi:hypothetical protein
MQCIGRFVLESRFRFARLFHEILIKLRLYKKYRQQAVHKTGLLLFSSQQKAK